MDAINETQARISQSGDRLRNQATANKGDKLEKSDFMNLFMYQLSNQNPLDPMDSDKMMASLSQLGSMEQLQSLNTKFSQLADNQKQLVQFSALSLINRKVQVRDNNFQYQINDRPSFSYNLPTSASTVKANVIDPQGKVVKQIDLGSSAAGDFPFAWDGKLTDGKQAADGNYRVEVFAYDEKGANVDTAVTKQAVISQVKFDNGQPLLKVDGKFLPLSEVFLIN